MLQVIFSSMNKDIGWIPPWGFPAGCKGFQRMGGAGIVKCLAGAMIPAYPLAPVPVTFFAMNRQSL